MEYFPAPLEKLVEQFARLPGVGYKSAQRLAFHVLELPQEEAQAFADAILDELAVEQLGHAKTFADFAQERQEFDIFEPVEIVDDGGILVGVGDANDLACESGFVVLDFVERLELAFGVVFWIADLASGATNQEICSITMAYEASAHHESSEVADVETISGRVGAPIKIARSFV